MKTSTHVFKTFPEFSELKLVNRDNYNELIADFPAIGDFSFSNLLTWWSHLDNPRVSQLGKNLVISYWLPGDEIASGLSIVGTDHVDEAVCEIFDYLRQVGESARLVHVPEFVVSQMKYLDLYNFQSERNFDECVVDVKQFALISKILPPMRWKVRRFLININKADYQVKTIDLTDSSNKQLLLDAVENWESKGGVNYTSRHETECTKQAILSANELGLENACIFVRGQLRSFIVYEVSSDGEYAIIGYTRISYDMPFIFEFCVHQYGEWFLSRGIKYANLVEDLGNPTTRAIKLSMGPINFFRKYTIEPRE